MLETKEIYGLAALVMGLAACAGQSSSGSEEVGTLAVPLVSTGSAGTQFALAGQFDLVGPETISVTVLSTDPDFASADVVTMTPRVGSYNLTLSGWKIYALTGNPPVPTVVTGAQLLSAASVPVSIANDQTATVVYRFAVPGSGTVVFARGTLNVDFTVAEGFPDGTACMTGSDCQSKVCDANQTCSPASCSDGVQNGMETSADCGGGCTCGGAGMASCVLINEVTIGGFGLFGSDYVELYNACAGDVDLTGATLVYRSANGTPDLAMVSFGAGSLIASGTYLLYAGSGYADVSNGSLANPLDSNGALQLRDAMGQPMDSVAWGTTTDFAEGMPAPAPLIGQSIARSPNGHDTDNNMTDFVSQARTPLMSNM